MTCRGRRWFAAALIVQAIADPAGAEIVEIAGTFPDERARSEAHRVAQAAWSKTVALLGLPSVGGSPSAPRVVVHVQRASYLRAEALLAGGRYRERPGFAWIDPLVAHVLVTSATSPSDAGMPRRALRTLAHEVAHLAIYARVRNARHHPRWLKEGAACWIAGRTLASLGMSAGIPEDPALSERVRLVQALDAAGRLPDAKALVSAMPGRIGIEGRYAIWWSFHRYLQSRGCLKSVWHAVDKAPNSPASSPVIARSVASLLGDGGESFAEFVRGDDARWHQEAPSLEIRGSNWIQRACRGRPAVAWRLDPLPERYCAGGAVEVIAPGGRAELVFVARSSRETTVAFDADTVVVESRTTDGVRKIAGLRRRGRGCLRFQLRVGLSRWELRLPGQVLAGPRSQWAHATRWGVRTSKDTCVRWNAITVAPLDAPRAR